jgi:hypothetical protein
MWSFLSVVHPLRILIPMHEKKIWVQQENSYSRLYKIVALVHKKQYVDYYWSVGRFGKDLED